MFVYLLMSYKDSDYIVMIAIVSWHRRIILVLKLTLLLELRCFCLPVGQALASTFVGSIGQTKILTTCHKCHCALTIRCQILTLVVKSLAQLEQHGLHVMCFNWNEP